MLPAAQAARALGISLDTLRRWDKEGRITVGRDHANRRVVAVSEIDRLRGEEGDPASSPRATTSAASCAPSRSTG